MAENRFSLEYNIFEYLQEARRTKNRTIDLKTKKINLTKRLLKHCLKYDSTPDRVIAFQRAIDFTRELEAELQTLKTGNKQLTKKVCIGGALTPEEKKNTLLHRINEIIDWCPAQPTAKINCRKQLKRDRSVGKNYIKIPNQEGAVHTNDDKTMVTDKIGHKNVTITSHREESLGKSRKEIPNRTKLVKCNKKMCPGRLDKESSSTKSSRGSKSWSALLRRKWHKERSSNKKPTSKKLLHLNCNLLKLLDLRQYFRKQQKENASNQE